MTNILYTGDQKINFRSGYNRINPDILNLNKIPYCSIFLQPIVSYDIRKNNPIANNFYGLSDYEKIFRKNTNFIGNIFHLRDSQILVYPNKKSDEWIPTEIDMDQENIKHLIAQNTIIMQNSFLKNGLNNFSLSEEKKALLRNLLKVNKNTL